MLRIRTHLGQYPGAPGQYPGYPQPQTQVDPLVHVGLQAAGQVLAPSDPGALQTVALIERLIVAPGLPSFGTSNGPQVTKLSDVNPLLEAAVFWREHPFLTIFGVLAVPGLAFLLGRRSAR